MIIFKERKYKLEKKFNYKVAQSHPLESVKNLQSKNASKQLTTKSSKIAYVDPLLNVSPLDILSNDKLSNFNDSIKSKSSSDIEPWSSKRLNILTNYTTTEKLSIISSFLINKPDEEVRILNKQSSSSVLDKVKSRLEQLDEYDEEVRETSNLTVQQFTDKIYELQNSLKLSWREGHRVKTLQIVIQSTKLLSESSVAQFFPSKFVLVTDLVDNFGAFVFERLKLKSAYTPRGSKTPIPLEDHFSEDQVPEAAKETAKNWFYKVASIRELVARLYVEATLLPCYRFFDAASIPATLLRLIASARGIGDPLLGTYARAYVVRVGIQVDPFRKDYIENAFDDTLNSLALLKSAVNIDSYLRLFMPAVDWILSCLCASASNSQLDSIVSKIQQTKNPLLLHSALNSISTAYIEKHTLHFAEMITEIPDGSYPKYIMYKQLGACVSLSYSLGQEKAMQLMKHVWKYIAKLTEPRQFIECADAWAEFLAMNFDNTYINRFIGHIAKEMMRDNGYHEFYNQLQSILSKIISYKCNFENLFSSSEFTQFLSLFDREHVVIEVRQVVLERFFSLPDNEVVSDPVVIHGCIRLLKEMHDSLNSLSIADNKRIVSKLVMTLLNKIRFEGKNVEQELDLLTQFRSTFGTMEIVIYNIIQRVNSLTMRVRSLRPNHEHNTGSASFVRACMAFNYITIPSIEDTVLAIKLYTTTAQVGLVNGCLGQAESCLKEAIQLISKMDNANRIADRIVEPVVVGELVANLASTLIMCPDISYVIADDEASRTSQMLYMMKGLINAVNVCPILKTEGSSTQKSMIKSEIFAKVLLALAALAQPDYVYHAGDSDANDKIYGGSEQFLTVVSEVFAVVVTKARSPEGDKNHRLVREALEAVLDMDGDIQNPVCKDWLAVVA